MQSIKHISHTILPVLSSWKRVLALLWKTNRRYVLELIVLTIFIGIVPSLQIQLTNRIIQSVSDAIQSNQSLPSMRVALLLGGLQGGLMLFSSLLSVSQKYVQSLLQIKIANTINIQIMEKALSLDIQYFEDARFYDTLQRATSESMYRPYQIFTQMMTLGSQCVTLISVTIILLSWNWWGLLLLIAPIPSLFAQTFYNQRGYKIERARTSQRRRLTYLQFLTTNSRSVKEIRLFRVGDYLLQQYRTLYHSFYKADFQLQKKQLWGQVPFIILTQSISIAVQVYAIVEAIATKHLGILAGYIQAIIIVQSTAQLLLWSVSQLWQSNLFVHDLFDLIDLSPVSIKGGDRPFPHQLRKGIEFRNVNFSYPGTSKVVLHDFNLFLKAGERVALVGENGAGKTTLVKLLTCLYEPTKGQILIDDVPINEYDLSDLRKHTSVIFQDYIQYEMTVRENVGFGYIEEINNAHLVDCALEKSGASSMLQEFPMGQETMLGRMFENGHELSGGQWQKIALARAFINMAPLLIFDEPTSAMDAQAEADLFTKLQHVMQGATAIFITHRLSSVHMADRIIVLEQGKVVEDGDHQALLELKGRYAHLFLLQAAYYNEGMHSREEVSSYEMCQSTIDTESLS